MIWTTGTNLQSVQAILRQRADALYERARIGDLRVEDDATIVCVLYGKWDGEHTSSTIRKAAWSFRELNAIRSEMDLASIFITRLDDAYDDGWGWSATPEPTGPRPVFRIRLRDPKRLSMPNA